MERLRYPKKAKELFDELLNAKDKGNLENKLLEIFGMYEMDMLQIWKCRMFFKEFPDEFYIKNKLFLK